MHHITIIARDVVLAIVPLALLFLIFQVFLLKLPLREVAAVLKGTLIASLGLFLFLLGVGLAFLPFGRALGMGLVSLDSSWLLLTIGALLGFLTSWGEPAVRILADQVEGASNGSIRKSVVLPTICARCRRLGRYRNASHQL